MVTVCEIQMCLGCMACVDICHKNAIEVVDELDCYNAVINDELCINCNLCKKVCPNIVMPKLIQPKKWFQGWAMDSKVRACSSSGGAAAALSAAFINRFNGIVCSCAFEKGKFIFKFSRNIDDLKKFTGSKYVKSNAKGAYKYMDKCLKEGKKVLFIGLPCQNAAVRNYMGDLYEDSLYLIDLICHGTPSPRLLEMFLYEEHHSLENLDDIQFRQKNDFELYKKSHCGELRNILPGKIQDLYTYAFLEGISYTENCYRCRYADIKRVSDITLGDSWGTELSDDEKKRGISLIICQTDKGGKLVKNSDIFLTEVNVEKAVMNNRQLQKPVELPKKRKRFFLILKNKKSFYKAFAFTFPKKFIKHKFKVIYTKFIQSVWEG